VLAAPLGIVSVAFGLRCPQRVAAEQAAALGFDHLDIGLDRREGAPEEPLALPVGDRLGSEPRAGCTVRAPRQCTWEEGVAFLRAVPGVRVEPSPPSLLNSVAAVRAMCEEVRGLRITLDTGWTVYSGEDPADLADLAGHVQLRQARRGVAQVHPDEPGDVDFGAFFERLAAVGYDGLLSVEYFDLPELGLPLEDPVGHCVALATGVRPLLVR
jgi:sugar phosphate isomerase/epimerase